MVLRPRRLGPRAGQARVSVRSRKRRGGASVFVLDGGADEGREERMRFERLGFEFRVELAAEEPRVVGGLDDFDVIFVRSASSDAQPGGDQRFLVVAIEFVAVAVALADLEFAVSLVREGT